MSAPRLEPLAPLRGIRIGVLVHDRPEYLRPCLESLLEATRATSSSVRVWLFDDASTQVDTLALVRDFVEAQPDWSVVRRERSGGDWASAYRWAMGHLAVGAERGTLMGTIDSDVIGQVDWIDSFASWAHEVRSGAADPPVFFSGFNSSDVVFHGPVEIRSAGGAPYLDRRRMGGAHLFCFAEDLPLIGPYPSSISVFGKVIPGLDDESIMTRRLQRRGLRNASVIESRVEHLGQISILNESRHAAVASAVYGLNQPSADWAAPFGVSASATPGLLQRRRVPGPSRCDRPLGALIVAAGSTSSDATSCVHHLVDCYEERFDWIRLVTTNAALAEVVQASLEAHSVKWVLAKGDAYRDAVEHLASLTDTDAVVVHDSVQLIRPVSFRFAGGYSALVRERVRGDGTALLPAAGAPARWWSSCRAIQMWSSEGARMAIELAELWRLHSRSLALLAYDGMVAAHGDEAIQHQYAFIRPVDAAFSDEEVQRIPTYDPTWALALGPVAVEPPWLTAARWLEQTRGATD